MRQATLALIIWFAGCSVITAAVPVPRQKPGRAVQSDAAAVPVPRPKPERSAGIVSPPRQAWPDGPGWPEDQVNSGRAACEAVLSGLNVEYRNLAPIGRAGGCGSPAPIELISVAGAAVAPPATMNCDVAVKLHGWMTDSVQPAAKTKLNSRVSVIHNAASYVCRSRNGIKGGKLSEHGRANALDMSGFSFDGRKSVAVGGGWGGLLQSIGLSKGGSFMGTIRGDACRYFTTVLGPGSDRYHGDHFHVDAIQRRNGGRICK